MAKTYTNQNKLERVKEPLLNVTRTKYRSTRKSEVENSETNLLKLDITRIYNQLESIDLQVLDNLTFFIGKNGDVTTAVLLNDGLTYSISGVQVYNNNDGTTTSLVSNTVNRLSSRIVRLINKVQRLETGQ